MSIIPDPFARREVEIIVPTYFNDIQRQTTKDSGWIAGLNVKCVINEPTRSDISYSLNHGKPQSVMIYDLGKETFDVSSVDIGEGVIEVLTTAGDDLDERIVQWITRKFK